MSFDKPENVNYAATVIKVPPAMDLAGLDNLVGVPLFGYQVLTQRSAYVTGELRVLFVAETQLEHDYASNNNLYREATLNKDASETGYIEDNRRVKAIRLRKHASNALLMPLESLAYTGYDVSTLTEGDTFDTLNGHRICRKYIPKGAKQAQGAAGPKVRKQVDEKNFPKHLDTEHLFRNLHYFRKERRAVTTQKLHGTSWRGGNVRVARDKGRFERFLNWLGYHTYDYEYKTVYGSRNVVKGRSDNNHFYERDLWQAYGEEFVPNIPKDYLIYGELIGWVSEHEPIQKNYTYDLPPGRAELYVYRVAVINPDGMIADLSWEGVKDFCATLDLKTVPEYKLSVDYLPSGDEDEWAIKLTTKNYLDNRHADVFLPGAVPLSDPKTVDEGVCVRIEGQVPHVFKAKSPKFLEHETKQLDKGEADLEAVA